MGVILTHLGHSPLFLPCWLLPENVNCFSYSVQHQFIYSYPCQCSLIEPRYILYFHAICSSCCFQIIIQNLLKYSLLDSIILYLIYESIKSFISCVCKTGALKSMKSLRKEGQNRSLSTLLNYLTIQLIISVSKKYFHLHICTSWLHLFSSLACGHESEC